MPWYEAVRKTPLATQRVSRSSVQERLGCKACVLSMLHAQVGCRHGLPFSNSTCHVFVLIAISQPSECLCFSKPLWHSRGCLSIGDKVRDVPGWIKARDGVLFRMLQGNKASQAPKETSICTVDDPGDPGRWTRSACCWRFEVRQG